MLCNVSVQSTAIAQTIYTTLSNPIPAEATQNEKRQTNTNEW